MPEDGAYERWPALSHATDWGEHSVQLLDDYLAIARHRGVATLERTALRTKSFAARHLFAHAATSGAATYAELVDAVRAHRARGGAGDPELPWLDPAWAIPLARVVGFQNLESDDTDVAVAIMSAVHDASGLEPFTSVHQKAYAELLYQAGEHARLRTLLRKLTGLREHTARHLHADLLNPFRSGKPGSRRRWLRSFNRIFRGARLEPVTLRSRGDTPFDRVECAAGPPVDGPPVTVIMTSYQPDESLVTSVRSILAQTWRNLELLIVDDASGAEFDPLLERCTALDPRVRVIRQPLNGGTYLARNAGLDAATGTFVTFQDSDDWSHPRRVEHQVRPLLDDPNMLATRSLSVRVNENLVFNRPGYEPTRANASSLMFRRREAMETVGYFDSVRKGADTEYHRRLMLTAPECCHDVPEPLALVRMADVSLSRADFSFGWHHPARHAYQTTYGHWHERVAAGDDSCYVPNDVRARAVQAPSRFDRHIPGRPNRSQHYDVVFLSEWRRYGGPQRSMMEEIRALTARGLRVGVAHMEAFRFMTSRADPLCTPLLELVDQGVVDLVQLDQGARISLLIIRYPPVLQFPPSTPTDIRVDRALILANQAPSERDGSDLRYTVRACEQTVRQLFGVECTWVPQGPIVRRALEDRVAAERLAGYDMPGILDLDEWATTRDRFRSDRPVLGRLSRDTAMKWPDDQDVLFDVYPDDDEFDVRVMGGKHTVRRITGSSAVPDNWLVYDQDEIPARQFLSQLDFFVYFHHPQWQEAFGRTILEAIATGCVAILPPHFRDLFGDAAVYCESTEVRDTVRRYYKDQERYREQVRRGYRFVQETFSHDAYARLVRDIGAGSSGQAR
ncbi:glycosyltransferase involved in cell wall biosynthesis [Haloactinopolyspora alba]|uniref:Glycosyltransferase involved in cell wall biosynthesis n=1 Tax=Haloactinopolyspora alba TaxID=648780 RepID=A0A2P8E0U5_9ACTN|nr:glycosyltransferase [Haloactinopolyspora alba]PSL03093.1 glycosyltransferase involved in cell wall biosynthesis [Haloactinopolyspora alba]